jgi:hypothetical protein
MAGASEGTMRRLIAAGMITALCALAGADAAPAQDKKGGIPKPKRAIVHSNPNFWKCKACFPAYERALKYVREQLRKTSFPAQMHAAWLLLADGRQKKDLDYCVARAIDWKAQIRNSQHARNWYPALAGLFLTEYYKFYPTPEVKKALEAIIKHFAEVQEITGGWFKWHKGAYTDRLDYPSKDLGMLTSIVYGMFWSLKTLRFEVPKKTFDQATACLDKLHSARGIAYGTPQRGGETTGARGSFICLGLDYAGQKQHKILKTYRDLLPKLIPNLNQGHHVGGLHCLGVVLGCRIAGRKTYQQLISSWLDYYLAEQKVDGNVYIGDDEDAGGEIGLLRGDVASTSAFALMILLQDPKLLRAGRKAGTTTPNPYAKKK